MDKLSHLIHDVVDFGTWHYLKIGSTNPDISHLIFVDDLILFGVAIEAQIQVFMNTLSKFCDSFGQKINMDK